MIEQEILFGKYIHAIQIVRYLRYTTGRFNWDYWRKLRIKMGEAMIEEAKTLKQLKSVNVKGINGAIKKAI